MLLGHQMGTWAAILRGNLTIAGMGGHVEAHADLSLRLVATEATGPDFCEVEPHARGSHAKSQDLTLPQVQVRIAGLAAEFNFSEVR